MPKVVEIPGVGNVEFPDSMNDEQISAAIRQKIKPAAPASTESGMLETGVQAVGDFFGGVGSGVFKTARGAASLLGLPESEYLNRLATAPPTMAGQVGQFAEQGAEFLVPGAAAGGYLKAVTNPYVRAGLGAGLEALGAGTVAGVQTGGDPEAMRNAALAGGAISGAASGVKQLAPWLKESAITQYGRALNPTKERMKAYAKEVIPELIQRRQVIGTLGGTLAKTKDRIHYFGQQIDDIWQQMEQAGTTADMRPVLQRLTDIAKENFYVTNTTGQIVPVKGAIGGGLKELEAIGQTILDASTHNPATGALEIPVASLRKLRQIWDDVADKSGAFHKSPRDLHNWTTGIVNRYAGDTVREELAKARPDLAAINREFSFWRKVGDVIEATMERRVGQQKPLTKQLMRVGGGIAGGTLGTTVGGAGGGVAGATVGPLVMEGLTTLVTSNAWRTVDAVMRNRIADAIAKGNRGQAEFYVMKALKAAGLAGITGRTEPAGKIPAPSAVR